MEGGNGIKVFSAVLKLAGKWLVAVASALVLFYLALIRDNFVLYAISFVVLGFAQTMLPSDMKMAGMFTYSFVEKVTSAKYQLIRFTKILAPALALLAFLIHRDFTTLFYAICIPPAALLPLLGVKFEEVLLPSILFSMGIVGNCIVALSTPVRYAAAVKASSFILVNSLTIPSLLYLIKAYRKAKGKGFLLTGQIVSIGVLMVGLAPTFLFSMTGEIMFVPWTILGLVVSGVTVYYLALTFAGKIWTTQIYYGDFFDEAIEILTRILDREKVEYKVEVKEPLIHSLQLPPPRRKFTILSPFKGTIVVRKWVHRAGRYLFPVGEAGLIVEVRPGPRGAPPKFRKIVAEFLEKLDLPVEDWKPRLNYGSSKRF